MNRTNILILLFLSLALTAFSQIEIEEVSITNIADINTEHDEFMPINYGEGIMYSSSNGESFGVKKDKCNDCCSYFQNLRYVAKKDGMDNAFQPATAVAGKIKGKYNYGTPTFSSDGKMMILSKNYPKSRSKAGKTLKLISAELSEEGTWTNLQELPFNLKGIETTHPALSSDGQKLYFASNREGGQGGMDIWMVMKQGDAWGIPTNLGPTINSVGNEIFPVLDENDQLSFSSNKVGGLGQLDIYTAEMNGGVWTTQNIGAPINSAGDDLGMVTLADRESGYLTSNRVGGKGKDDLYYWKVNSIPVQLAVEDATNTSRLAGAKVSITGGKEDLNLETDASGGAKSDFTYRRNYTVTVEKPGYETWTKEVTAKELAMVSEYVVPLTPRAYRMVGDVKLLDNESGVASSKIVLHNITTGEKREVIADNDGKFTFDNIHCFEDYELIAYKEDRESKKVALPASKIDCANNSRSPTKVTLRLPAPVSTVPVCACNDLGKLSLPLNATPKVITALGSRPQFGDAHALDAAGFYKKLKKRYSVSKRDAAYLDDLFKTMGYANGFADINAYNFSETSIPNGMVGNMGYTRSHRYKYVQLNARNARDLVAFRVTAVNGCDTYFMKTCGNLFFFCNN